MFVQASLAKIPIFDRDVKMLFLGRMKKLFPSISINCIKQHDYTHANSQIILPSQGKLNEIEGG